MSSEALTNVFSQIHSLEESLNLCHQGVLLVGDELIFVPYLLAEGQVAIVRTCAATGVQFQFESWNRETPTG